MTSSEIYLDHAATTPVVPEVRNGLAPFLAETFGNPSSRHRPGVRAADAIDEARRRVARATGARSEQVVFTSGGTEANNLGVLGWARAGGLTGGRRGATSGHVLVGPTEHSCVREPAKALAAEGFDVETLRLDDAGELDLDDLTRKLRDDTVVVAQMFVNNEFGTVYPIERVARLVRARAPRAALHVDAVQGIGKLEVSLDELGCDSLAISAHKIHGPKGVGALACVDPSRLAPLVFGGGQEGGARSGTENVAGIVALGIAAELADRHADASFAHMQALRNDLARELERVHGARLLDPGARRSPAIAAVLLPGAPAEVWMHHLEEHGIYTSVGSACQAKKSAIPEALRALGLDEDEAKRVLRISFSRVTTADEIRAAVDAMVAIESGLGVTR